MRIAIQFHEEGFVILPSAIEQAECDAAIEELRSIPPLSAGTRNLLSFRRGVKCRLRSYP